MKEKVILLHSNDFHNQMFFKMGEDMLLHGGISMLSEYVRKVKESENNVLYTISGDILQEDISGSDYKGTNTVNIVNTVGPDAVSLGNHELDYGLAHLLIFKECISAPVLNANIIVREFQQNLFVPSMILKAGDVRILAIGVIPMVFYKQILSDPFCNTMLEYKDTYDAIREEIAKYSPVDYDMTILLSHYGLKGDEKLAEEMPSDIHINVILGGHDHIDMDKAVEVNDILIAQSSYGTTHIGRFDIELNTVEKKICSYKWQRIEINSELCGYNTALDNLIDKSVASRKPVEKRIVCTFKDKYTHKTRLYETQLGDIISDAFYHEYKPDFVILQSGSLRKDECPIEMKETDLKELYPFDGSFCIADIPGKQIKKMMYYLFSVKPDGSIMNGTFQYSNGFRLVANAEDYKEKGYVTVEEISLHGKPIDNERVYHVGVTRNCLNNFKKYFNTTVDPENFRTVSFSTFHDLEKVLLSHEGPIRAPKLGKRFVLKNWNG